MVSFYTAVSFAPHLLSLYVAYIRLCASGFVSGVVSCVSVTVYPNIIYFVLKQKTAYEMRISDWSSDVRSSDRGCCALCQRFRRDGGYDGEQHGTFNPSDLACFAAQAADVAARA